MALSVAQLNSTSQNGSSSQTKASGSFTPTALARLFVFAACDGDTGGAGTYAWSISNTGGLTFGAATLTTIATNFQCALFEATVGGSPSSMTVTVDPFSGTQTGWISLVVFEVTGGNSGFVQAIGVAGENEGGGNTETLAVSLPGNATTGNLVVACFGALNNTAGAFTNPTSWTQLTNQTTVFTHCLVTSRQDFTTASVTCTDLGQSVDRSGAVIFEISASSGAAFIASRPLIVRQAVNRAAVR